MREVDMSTIRLIAVTLLFLSGLAVAPLASAQGPWYIGGSVGKSDFDDGNVVPALITSGTVDGSDTGFKIFGGYQFNKQFGVEIAWVDLGKASYSGTFGGAPVTGGSLETSGLNFSVVGTLPLNPSFELFGKVGFFMWEAKANDVTGGVPFSAKDDGTDVSYGIGLGFNINKNFSVRVEWEQFEAVDKVSLFSLGVVFKF